MPVELRILSAYPEPWLGRSTSTALWSVLVVLVGVSARGSSSWSVVVTPLSWDAQSQRCRGKPAQSEPDALPQGCAEAGLGALAAGIRREQLGTSIG